MKLEKTINNIGITFHTEWCNNDGEKWSFTITIDSPFAQSCDRYDYLSASSIADTLAYLDEEAQWSSMEPVEIIGDVDHATLKALSEELEKIRNDTYPSNVSAHDNYYGM